MNLQGDKLSPRFIVKKTIRQLQWFFPVQKEKSYISRSTNNTPRITTDDTITQTNLGNVMIETEDEAIPAINSTRYSSTHLPAGGGAALERSGVSHHFLHHDSSCGSPLPPRAPQLARVRRQLLHQFGLQGSLRKQVENRRGHKEQCVCGNKQKNFNRPLPPKKPPTPNLWRAISQIKFAA